MIRPLISRDAHVRDCLISWPQCPPGITEDDSSTARWMRARPCREPIAQPFLKVAGSARLRTLPDGLWFCFGGTVDEPFVDVFAIEACGTLPNLLDKRSRFAPSTQSLMAVCPARWLNRPLDELSGMLRWKATGILLGPPSRQLVLPVRDIRVMYGLEPAVYTRFRRNQLPHPHELYAPVDALVADDALENAALRALVARASATANFLTAAPRRRARL